MAFDEDFHLGIIKIYSEQWLPYLSGQPEGANAFGAVAADPSYLFHYLMSFPYRLIALLTDSQAAQVIFLRLINIAIITAGVLLFRKVFVRAGASPLVTNVATLLFALVPTVPLLAGQINYDNVLVLALAGLCYLILHITDDTRVGKVNLKTFSLLVVLLLLANSVKYVFLPLALAAAVYVAGLLVWRFRGRWQALYRQVTKSYKRLGRVAKWWLLALLVVSTGLFVQRYGVNAVKYGTPLPSCDKVIGIEACMEYGPWGRNYRYAAEKQDFSPNPITYTWVWLQGLHYRLFFVVSGPPLHTNYPPALLPSAAAIALLLFGLSALAFYWRQVFRGHPFLLFLLGMAVVYIGALWALQNYPQYLYTGQPVAINGRYLIPLLLPLAILFARALGVALKSWPAAKVWVATLVILLFLQGGGVFSFILRSDETWYWPNNAVIEVNESARQVLSKVLFIGPKHY
jgi:hypothetical protein